MRLNYSKTSTSGRKPVVLTAEQMRIEFHIRTEADGRATLLGLSGSAGKVTRTRHQGPYELLDQALAARNAIMQSLLDRGFCQDDNAHAIWSLEAQKEIRSAREANKRGQGNYLFNPKDVFLDW